MRDELIFQSTSMPDWTWWAAMFADPIGILTALGIAPGMTVLDLCYGDGYFTTPLSRMTDGRLYALDLDPELIERARLEVARQGGSVRKWFIEDARDVDKLLPEPVDYVLLANAFHGVPDQRELMVTMARCLKPGGLIGLLNWHPLPREETIVLGEARGPDSNLRMPAVEAAAIVGRAGLTVQRIVDIPPFHYGLIASV